MCVRRQLAAGTEAELEEALAQPLIGVDDLHPGLALGDARQRKPRPLLAVEDTCQILMRCSHHTTPLCGRCGLIFSDEGQRAIPTRHGRAPRLGLTLVSGRSDAPFEVVSSGAGMS